MTYLCYFFKKIPTDFFQIAHSSYPRSREASCTCGNAAAFWLTIPILDGECLVHKINTRIDFSALFNSKSVESLMLIKESFTYNCHKNHLLIKFVLAWKKYSPFIFLVYSIVNYSHAISMCFYACFKRLPLKTAFSFIFRCLKHQKDLTKYIDQQEEHNNKKLRMTLRRLVRGIGSL